MHAYLVGHHITLQALIIYKPLMVLFNEAKAVPQQASGLIQCWALMLSMSKPRGLRSMPANAISCLLLPEVLVQTPLPEEVFLVVEGLEDALPATRV